MIAAIVPAVVGSITVELAYMAAALLFVLGLKRLSGVKTARRGSTMAAGAMLLATVATLALLWGTVSWIVIVAGIVVGSAIGAVLAVRVPMTAMPELVAFFNGMGGAASMFVALSETVRFQHAEETDGHGLADVVTLDAGGLIGGAPYAIAIMLSILIGAVTLSGSLIAYAKLAGKIRGNRIGPLGVNVLNVAIALGCLVLLYLAAFSATSGGWILALAFLLTAVALLLGVGLVVGIGGADMPVVISLLNSYSGLAAAATGFVVANNLLIIAGSLVGASGLILTRIMCKAMNRSLTNVLFGGFGEQAAAAGDDGYVNVKSTSAEEVAPLLDAAQSVIVVPGYGMAVAQAQHKVREMADLLERRGTDVRYAIHPVAGRMPGHMNVLLAEADVSYDKLFDLEQINSEFKNTDVVIVLGANDVCNPAASDPKSPIAGMPVLDVWDAQTVVVIKRSLSAGYAGIKNDLFERNNTLMLFADGKKAMEDIVAELREL